MKRVRLAAASLVTLGAVFAFLFVSGILVLNTTKSVPVGLWIRAGGPIGRGDFVVLDVSAFSGFSTYQDYPFKQTTWGKVAPFVKAIAGVSGDIITGTSGGLAVNGVLIPDSAPISMDRLGNAMPAYPLPYELKAGELWLCSQTGRGFDSRYLGFARVASCKKVVPLVTF